MMKGGIMNLPIKALVEVLHIMFLRQFDSLMENNFYAIKGGCNLRFFFNSQRYSEDLDIDVQTIQKETLKKKVDKILDSQALLKTLSPYGIERLECSAPKQTGTTQRWKIGVHAQNREMPLHTKIEFSRRSSKFEPELQMLSLEVTQRYGLPPTRLSHYPFNEAIHQKILALAHRSQVQSRDIFDIYHLLHLSKPQLVINDQQSLLKAQENLCAVKYEDFLSQVVTFLAPSEQATYSDSKIWEVVSNQVFDFIGSLKE